MDDADIQELTDRAREALDAGDDVRALAITDQVLAVEPEHGEARIMRAQALLSSENVDEAVVEARLAADLNPQSGHAQSILGLAAWRAERLTLAQASLERAVKLSGGRPDVLAEYAWFMACERGPRLAETAARRALLADESSSTAWAALGWAQYRLHQHRDAERSLRRALQLNPNDLYAQSAMAMYLQRMRHDEGAEALADLLRDTPGAEQFVEEVRREAKNRQIAKMLVERNVAPEDTLGVSPRRRAAWLVLTAFVVAGLWILIQPQRPLALAVCIGAPLVFLLLMRRMFD